MSADGNRCGSCPRPIAKATSKTANNAAGKIKRSLRLIPQCRSQTRELPRLRHAGRCCGGILKPASLLPMPALFQGIDDFPGDIVLVVLGEHARSHEDAVRS